MYKSIIMFCGIATACVFTGYFAYRVKSDGSSRNNSQWRVKRNASSLDEDLLDVIAFVPFDEVHDIIENYAMYDKQTGNAVSFINDTQKFVTGELVSIPEFDDFLQFLQGNGFDIDRWRNKLESFWRTLPEFVKEDQMKASGGLAAMLKKILNSIPTEELSMFLAEKVQYSESFRNFLVSLTSQQFSKLCNAMSRNIALTQLICWAQSEDLDVAYVSRILEDVYNYTKSLLLTRNAKSPER